MADSNTQEQIEERPVDLGALSDEEIATMSPDEVEAALKMAYKEDSNEAAEGEAANDASEPDTDQDGAQSATAGEEEETGSEETGGADSDFQTLGPSDGAADTAFEEESTDASNEDDSQEATDQGGEDDQSSQADGEAERDEDSTGEIDYKSKYKEAQARLDGLLGPFKASGRTVKLESPDDARRLMQMGYDYTNKMREMKPHLKVLKTLEHNDLLEPEKINFAIDLLKGNPEAVKKFLKDKDIDPIELDLEDGTDYKPNDHSVSEEQMALDEVLDSIKDSEAFGRTANVISKEWDTASQNVLMGNPSLIAVINDHMELGYYDQIASKVQYERSLGRLKGLSDLDAYKTVGDAMHAQGAFKAPTEASNTPSAKSGQGPSQDSKGSDDEDSKKDIQNRKRAASPTKGNASAGKALPKNFLADFSDEEIESMG